MNIAIIPSRMKSKRFPGKPIRKIENLEIINHVYLRSSLSRKLNEVYVATCDQEIVDAIKKINGKFILTSKKHSNAIDRSFEAINKIIKKKKIKNKKINIIIIQGDEPMVHPKMIQSVISALKKNKIVNIYTILKSQKDIVDKNRVKVILDKAFNATYFSRAPILNNLNRNNKYLKQGNLFGFKYEGLKKFCELKRTKLEEFESIDMLRLIENDIKIKMIKVNHETINIDTLDDFKKAVKTFKNDKLKKNYL